MNSDKKKAYLVILLLAVFLGISLLFYYKIEIDAIKREIGEKLELISLMGAAGIDGDDFEELFRLKQASVPVEYQKFLRTVGKDQAYKRLEGRLKRFIDSQKQFGFNHNNMYVFARNPLPGGERLFWALMSHKKNFTGQNYKFNPAMLPVIRGERNSLFTDVYLSKTSNRKWVSAYAAIKNEEGKTVGVFETSWEVENYLIRLGARLQKTLCIILIVFILLVFVAMGFAWVLGRLFKVDQEKELISKKLNYDSSHDKLTSLPNRNELEVDLKKEREEAPRVLMLRISNIDEINFAYGNNIGDVVILEISIHLRELLNETQMLYRVGGARFLILDEGRGAPISDSITNINLFFADQNIEVEDAVFQVGFFFGVVENEFKDLLEKASISLINSINMGPGRYQAYDPQENAEESFKQNLIKSRLVSHAFAEDAFFPVFQPIYNNKSGLVTKYECLVRMQHGDEVLAPFAFLEAVKRSGKMHALTLVMLDKCTRFFKDKDVEFSLNITSADLIRPDFYESLRDSLSAASISPERLTVEILENIGHSFIDQVLVNLKKIQEMGCHIAIDDFGIDYSNFGRLLEIHADYIKIDGSLIKQLNDNPHSYNIVKTVTHFSHSIGAKVVAEFVSSKEIQDTIMELGIDYSQGWFFGKPEPFLLD